MKYNGDVNIYSNQIEKLYFKLCSVNLLNTSETEAKIMLDTLTVYIKVLIGPIKTIVK